MIETQTPPASSPGNHPPTTARILTTRDLGPTPGVCSAALPRSWTLEHGATLIDGRLAYELSGPPGAPVIVVQGGISAGSHVTATAERPEDGWWQPVVGPGRAVDTRRFRVLSFDFIGGNGLSSGPRNSGAGDFPGGDFPAVSTADQARALAHLLDRLGLERIEAFVGASYGGMVALAFAALFPSRLRQLVMVSAADRSHPQATAWRSLQRKIVRLARSRGAVHEGLALSRGLAMVTYRTPDELAQRFDAAPRPGAAGFRFPIDDYLEARGEAFARTFHPEAFLCLSESIDLHRVDPSPIAAAATLVAVCSDQLVPIEQMHALSRRLSGACRWVEIDSLYGHDAFLKEIDAITDVFESCFEDGAQTS